MNIMATMLARVHLGCPRSGHLWVVHCMNIVLHMRAVLSLGGQLHEIGYTC